MLCYSRSMYVKNWLSLANIQEIFLRIVTAIYNIARNYTKLYICFTMVLICSLSKHAPSIYFAWLNVTFFPLIFFMISGILVMSQFLKSVWLKLILAASKLELQKLLPIRSDFLNVTSQLPLNEQQSNEAPAKLQFSKTTFIEPTNVQLVNTTLSMLHLLNETLCLNETPVKLKLSSFLFSKITSFFVSPEFTKSFMSSYITSSFSHTSSILSIPNERILFKPSN